MLFISKAQEISKLYEQYEVGAMNKKEYNERMSAILYAAYRPFDTGVSMEQEKQLLWDLVVDDVINHRDYEEQLKKIKQAMIGQSRYRYEYYPPLKKKKGYVAPIVWIVIGFFCWHTFWLIPLGILIIILALIGLSCRVSHNKSVEVENSETMMRYGKKYSY
jgi:hypothetical protein